MEEEKNIVEEEKDTEVQDSTATVDGGDNVQTPTLSKEEILARSRKENKRGDERTTGAMFKAGYLAMFVGGLVCAVVYLLFQLILDELHPELMFVYVTMWTVFMWVQYYYLRRKWHLGSAIGFTVATVGFLVFLILQLIGIM